MGAEEGQPLMKNGPLFEWAPGDPILDENDNIDDILCNVIDMDYGNEDDDICIGG